MVDDRFLWAIIVEDMQQRDCSLVREMSSDANPVKLLGKWKVINLVGQLSVQRVCMKTRNCREPGMREGSRL
jgi:hypothetical protein